MNLKYKSWDNIPIKIYYKIVDILKQYENLPEKQIIPILSLLYDTDEKEIGKLKIYDVSKLISQVDWINNFSFDKENKIQDIEVNGIKSRIKYDLSKFSYKQFLDYQEYQKKLDTDITYIPNVLATFIIPEGKEYDEGYEMQEWVDTIEEYLPITTAQNLMYFFLKGSLQLLNRTQTSLGSRRIQKMIMKKKLNKK